ncbi:EF-hand domain-containing protein [Thetidibacter halocola]|uniref:EF-hand domain-containing protein n=1 Tax=Thetidibacter halocola TaxID=2827239 RepID=A0A8J8BAJ8_9RHOB|nr:EF-hand domain-containing protein [Thetidibacter halocola]MBS0125283.1 EF-hand domain-containing protein [Thetidibacter halocola]
MKPACFAIVIAAGLASGPAFAATFSELDTDGNGRLSVEEFTEAFGEGGQEAFDSYDANGDGSVSLNEVRANADASGTEEDGDGGVTFGDLDTNGDGVIDKGEMIDHFGARAQQALAKFDANGDGYVTLNEVRSSDDPKGARGRGGLDRAERDGDRAGNRGGQGNGKGNSGDRGNGGDRGNSGNGGDRGNGGGNGKDRG